MLEFIKALMAIGFTENQANQIAMAEQVEECTKTWAKERSAQLWFSRWHEGLRLLVWESQAPGPDYFAMTVNIEDALNELLNPVLQLDFRDAPENLLILYKREHSAKYVVYDNGSDYRLVAYEYFPPNANESTKRSEAGVAYPLILDEQKLAQPGDGFDPWSYSTDSPNSTDDCIRFADGIECIIWREGRWQLEPDDREESTD